jgi:transposase-like protein
MRKSYTPTFKAQVVRELLKEELTAGRIAAKYDVHPTQLHQWKATAIEATRISSFGDERRLNHRSDASPCYLLLATLTQQDEQPLWSLIFNRRASRTHPSRRSGAS